jgi:hypothetical protein
MNSLIGGTLNWITHPSQSEGTPKEWLAGLGLILILAVLWSRVLSHIAKAI